MKKLVKQYQSKTLNELEKERQVLSEEIAKLKITSKVNPQKDTNLIFKKRKQLAVLLTVISEKKAIESLKK
jgi:ribosomal protein L29